MAKDLQEGRRGLGESANTRNKKYFSRFKEPLTTLPNLIEGQTDSFNWLIEKGLKEVFDEFGKISDYTGKKFEFSFGKFELGQSKSDEQFAVANKGNYEAPLKVMVKLKNKILNSEKEQEVFMADFPIMTSNGTFIINGIERVIVPQLARSFGVFFTQSETSKGLNYFGAKIIPARGAWVEIETDSEGVMYVRIDRKRKFPVTALLKAFGAKTPEEITALFNNTPQVKKYLEATLAKDHTKTAEEAVMEIHKKLRDGDMATADNAREYVTSLFDEERYDLSRVGRHRFNKRFNKGMDEKSLGQKTLSLDDLKSIIVNLADLNNAPDADADDIDHLGSRRVRFVGELLQQKIRVGMTQIKRNIQNRMSTIDTESTLPIQFISPRPLQARIKEFFTTNQLSQFMQQENVLTELEHLRTVSALGPGGLTRERAGFEVRDVHSSHYGRICPIHTPEGPNIGLVLHLSSYARINEFGMIETPYAKVKNGKVTKEVSYLNALEEEGFVIAHAGTSYDKAGNLLDESIEVRVKGKPSLVSKEEVELIDVATNQAFSIATSMIPFVNHDEANRALMASNMQKQATPCVIPEAPLVATGIERKAAEDTKRVILAEADGVVAEADARKIKVKYKEALSNGKKEAEYSLAQFQRTNQFTAYHQRPQVSVGQEVKKGDVLADSSTTVDGEMSLGQNCLVAFMTLNGQNYEDAIVISERLVKNSKFSSIHIEEFVINVRDTKLGPEITTHDIPNVGENKLKNLDEDGIVRIGAEVRPGDILVGKITPKGETQLTPEERLLRSIFGEKSRDVKDTSKRMENGKRGRIISVKVFSREKGDKLESG
ncbi:MAG: DNA-directed polymerase subunit beta, partial [Patescibacteria group bacterium]|nr:DNA-directed polymerase subunit beta [Patescibacteria group bacterium]